MRVNEYGVVFRFSVGYDISAETELTLDFTKPDDTTLQKLTADGVAVGTSQVTTTLGVFAANEYITYTFASGDVDQAGVWTAQLTYDDATPKHLISDTVQFTIDS